jgi:phage terminase Nu1 subunit (DNA packaging protein)
MTDDTKKPADVPDGRLDPKFFQVVNEYLELTNKHAKDHGLKRISMASLYAAARFNVHAFMAQTNDIAGERTAFLDYMSKLYRQMLNEHIDGLGHERSVDVGHSELQEEIARLNAEREAQGLPPVK